MSLNLNKNISYFIIIFITIFSLVIDTFAYIYKPFLNIEFYNILRIIGRIYFPLISFITVDFCKKSNNKINIIFILLLLGLINNFLKELMFFMGIQITYEQNFLITLSIGLITIEFYNYYSKVNKFITFIVILIFMIISEFIHSDYASYGILMMLIFNLSKDYFILVMSFIFLNVLNILAEYFFYNYFYILQIFSLLSLPFIYLYKYNYPNKRVNIMLYGILFLIVYLLFYLIRYLIFKY